MHNHNIKLNQYLKRSASLVAAIMMLSFTASGHSSVITSGCYEAESCTLAELFAGGSITVNDKIFENWEFEINYLDSDFSQIVVTGFDDGGNNPGPGLRYDLNGQASYIGGEFADEYTETVFYYDVATIDESATIIGTSLKLIDFHIIEDYVGGVGIVEGAYGIGSDGLYHFLFGSHMGVPNTRNDDPLLDSRYFDPQSRIRIETELRIHAHEQFAGGSIDSFEQRFSQSVIPVPPALWLFGAGLLGLVGIARRRSNTSLPINRKQYLSRSHSPLRGLFHRNSDMH